MMREGFSGPVLRLGELADESIAVSIYALVGHAALRQPELARALRGRVRLCFAEGYAPVRIDFRGVEIEVADDLAPDDCAHDLELRGRLGDFSALLVAPLAGGLPKPTTRRGRRAIARLADGRVDFDGPLGLARALLRLLAIDARAETAPVRRVETGAAGVQSRPGETGADASAS